MYDAKQETQGRQDQDSPPQPNERGTGKKIPGASREAAYWRPESCVRTDNTDNNAARHEASLREARIATEHELLYSRARKTAASP